MIADYIEAIRPHPKSCLVDNSIGPGIEPPIISPPI